MEQLCNGHEVRSEDLGVVKFSVVPPLTAANKRKHWTGKCRRIDSRSAQWENYKSQLRLQLQQQQQGAQANQPPAQIQDWLKTSEAATQDVTQWEAWLDSQAVLDSTSVPADGSLEEDRLAVVVSSRVSLTGFGNKVEDGNSALRYSPIQRDCFLAITQRLGIHRMYLSLLEEGSPCAVMFESSFKGRPCQVYLLRTSNAMTRQSAIAVTHFPRLQVQTQNGATITIGARTNAFISGYADADYKDLVACLRRFDHFPFAPSRLLIGFLEIEKEKRFRQVREQVVEMQTLIHEIGREPVTETPSMRRKLNKTVELYFVVHTLRTNGLVAWRDQLRMLRDRLLVGAGGGSGAATVEDATMATYLEQLAARYEHRIGRCEMVLQGASLAYQMESTQLSRKDTEIAIGDGKTMKAIAVLTMIFLPGTFIATMLAVPQIEAALDPEKSSTFGDAKWLWYVVLAIPITVISLLAYAAWEYLYKRKYLKSLFSGGGGGNGDGRDGKGGSGGGSSMMEMWDLESNSISGSESGSSAASSSSSSSP